MGLSNVKTAVRFAAIEYSLCQLWVTIYKLSGVSRETIEKNHAEMLAKLRLQTFGGLDPAVSDLTAAELEEAVSALLEIQREMMGYRGK